jgi:type I restriction enzyme, R subunit
LITDINSEDRLVQKTFADHLHDALGWECVYAYKTETFGPNGTLGRASEREVVLLRDLRAALARLNPVLLKSAQEQAVEKPPAWTSPGPCCSITANSMGTSVTVSQ